MTTATTITYHQEDDNGNLLTPPTSCTWDTFADMYRDRASSLSESWDSDQAAREITFLDGDRIFTVAWLPEDDDQMFHAKFERP